MSTPTAPASSSAPTTYLNHCPMPIMANISTIAGEPNTLANPAIANWNASRAWSTHSAMPRVRLRVAVVDGVWPAVPVPLIGFSSSDPSSRLLPLLIRRSVGEGDNARSERPRIHELKSLAVSVLEEALAATQDQGM